MIADLLVLTGLSIILFGFLMLIIGTAIGLREKFEPAKGESKRRDMFERENDSGKSFRYEGSGNEESYSEKTELKIRGGGVIMLGPIPIIFGSDKESAKTAIILAIILMFLSLLIFRGALFRI